MLVCLFVGRWGQFLGITPVEGGSAGDCALQCDVSVAAPSQDARRLQPATPGHCRHLSIISQGHTRQTVQAEKCKSCLKFCRKSTNASLALCSIRLVVWDIDGTKVKMCFSSAFTICVLLTLHHLPWSIDASCTRKRVNTRFLSTRKTYAEIRYFILRNVPRTQLCRILILHAGQRLYKR